LSKSLALRVNQKKQHIETSGIVPSIGRQAELLGIARSSVYYQAIPVSEEALRIKNKIDEIYTKCPFYGVRKITEQLHKGGETINHKRVHGFMQDMGIQALYPKPRMSKSNPAHSKYPYLLKGITAGYPNHIWGTDITYIRMYRGCLYLVAYLDWFSRYVLSWRLATTLALPFVLEAAEEALDRYGAPYIENSDQGSHFTSEQHTKLFLEKETKISMDSRGRAMDNIFTERLWRTIKYEEVYLKSYVSVQEAKENMKAYIDFYNNERLHQSLKYKTPKETYEKNKR
jgi:putative transposase